jgi:hypothetical protein
MAGGAGGLTGMRYEGKMKVTGYVDIVVDEPGLTLAQAKSKAECYPETYKCMFVESLEFEEWDEDLAKTEDDEADEEE